MLEITSLANPRVKDAFKLKRGPDGSGRFLIEGPNLIEMAEGAKGAGGTVGAVTLESVFLGEDFIRRHPGAEGTFGPDTDVILASRHVIEKLSFTEHPQGIVAVARMDPGDPEAALEAGPAGYFLVLDGVSDPGNVGSAIRTADAAGAVAVFLTGGSCDPRNQKAMRASAGSVFNLPVVVAGAGELTGMLRGRGIRICTASAGALISVFEADLCGGGLALVLGSEVAGVGPEFTAAAEMSVAIPMEGRAESLNVAASAAVILYEALRQRTASAMGRSVR